ncbi:unnamed protein product [Sphacelaria rigidula]
MQRLSFTAEDPPPFHDWGAPPSKLEKRKKRKSGKSSKGRVSGRARGGHESQAGDGNDCEEEVVDVGYVGVPKGSKQVLWERGLWESDMFTSDTVHADMDVATVLANLPVFKQEKGALQAVVEGRGHILVVSPKFHPEVAGVGIGYSWGKAKQTYHREINDEVPENLHRNIVRSLCVENVLTLERMHRFARRTRDFCRAYSLPDNQGAINSMERIDMEPAFIDRQ